MPITKRIRRVGGSATLIIPRAVLDMIGWSIGTEVTITPRPSSIVVAKLQDNDGAKDQAA